MIAIASALLCFAPCSCHNCDQSRLHFITIVIKASHIFLQLWLYAGHILSQLWWNAGQLFPSELSLTRNNVSAGVGSSSTLVHRSSHPDNVTAVGSLGMCTARRKMQLERPRNASYTSSNASCTSSYVSCTSSNASCTWSACLHRSHNAFPTTWQTLDKFALQVFALCHPM